MDERYLYLSTLKYLNEEKLSVRTVNIDDKKLSVSFRKISSLAIQHLMAGHLKFWI